MSWAASMTACRDVGGSAVSGGPEGGAGTGADDGAGLSGFAADTYVFLFVAALLLPEPVPKGDTLPAAGTD